jgi:hypothetical protein
LIQGLPFPVALKLFVVFADAWLLHKAFVNRVTIIEHVHYQKEALAKLGGNILRFY